VTPQLRRAGVLRTRDAPTSPAGSAERPQCSIPCADPGRLADRPGQPNRLRGPLRGYICLGYSARSQLPFTEDQLQQISQRWSSTTRLRV